MGILAGFGKVIAGFIGFVILITLFLFGVFKEEKDLNIHIKCSESLEKLHYEVYIDDDFIGSYTASCPSDSERLRLYEGSHKIRIAPDNKTPFEKDIKILGTFQDQEISVDFN